MNQPQPSQRSWPRRLLNRLEVDQAVFFALAARIWQLLAGPVTLLLIAWHFAPEVQGFYYTFWSIIALQTFFELSFPQVIINFASHEWQGLQLDEARRITGDSAALSRLSSLLRLSLVWYGAAAILFLVIVCSAGLVFFSHAASSEIVVWRAPWCTLVALTAVTFATIPCVAVLEGCNQVKSVYQLQFAQAVAGNFFVWAAIVLGAGLWTLAIAAVVRLLAEMVLVVGPYGRFFRQLLACPAGASIRWRDEVWPFQWRLAIKSIVTYFNTYFMGPVIFGYHGEIAAGQLGMTWQVLTSLHNACAAWVRTRAARFGILVARQDYQELDRIFIRLTVISVLVLVIASGLFVAFDILLHELGSRFAGRLLPPAPTIVFAVGTSLALISACQWIYIHAHKRSPYLLLTIVGSLMTGGLIWVLGREYGVMGAAVAYTGVMTAFYLPVWTWVWLRCRKEWHQQGSRAALDNALLKAESESSP